MGRRPHSHAVPTAPPMLSTTGPSQASKRKRAPHITERRVPPLDASIEYSIAHFQERVKPVVWFTYVFPDLVSAAQQ